MNVIMLGTKVAETFKNKVREKRDDIDVSTYDSIVSLNNMVDNREVLCDRVIITEEVLTGDTIEDQLEKMQEIKDFFDSHYLGLQMVLILKNEELQKGCTEICYDTDLSVVFCPGAKLKVPFILAITTKSIAELRELYSDMLYTPSNDTQDDYAYDSLNEIEGTYNEDGADYSEDGYENDDDYVSSVTFNDTEDSDDTSGDFDDFDNFDNDNTEDSTEEQESYYNTEGYDYSQNDDEDEGMSDIIIPDVEEYNDDYSALSGIDYDTAMDGYSNNNDDTEVEEETEQYYAGNEGDFNGIGDEPPADEFIEEDLEEPEPEPTPVPVPTPPAPKPAPSMSKPKPTTRETKPAQKQRGNNKPNNKEIAERTRAVQNSSPAQVAAGVRYNEIISGRGVGTIIVTGDRRNGLTTTAMAIADHFSKFVPTLYVDYDIKFRGSLYYLGIDDLACVGNAIQNGLGVLKSGRNIRTVTYRAGHTNFDSLVSLPNFCLTDTQLQQTQLQLFYQREYNAVVIDCPFADLYLLEDLLGTATIYICVSGDISSCSSTIQTLDVMNPSNDMSIVGDTVHPLTEKGIIMMSRAQYLITGNVPAKVFADNMNYLESLYKLNTEELDWADLKIAGICPTWEGMTGNLTANVENVLRQMT